MRRARIEPPLETLPQEPRNFEPLRCQISQWQSLPLEDNQAKLILYAAFVEKQLPVPRHLLSLVHQNYFEPEYKAFRTRTLWSLRNAFTAAFKVLKPIRQYQAAAKLGTFLEARSRSLWSEPGEPAVLLPAARETPNNRTSEVTMNLPPWRVPQPQKGGISPPFFVLDPCQSCWRPYRAAEPRHVCPKSSTGLDMRPPIDKHRTYAIM